MTAGIKNRKRGAYVAFGAVLLSLLFFVPDFAQAQSMITEIGAGVVTYTIGIGLYLINMILGFLFSFVSTMVDIGTGINAQILDSSNAIVNIGWTIARDVANLGFVLIMIVMAVATIVRYEKYSAKKLLPLLIGAAILVNFSLTIAGVFIDFSRVLTNTFSQNLTGTRLKDAVAGAFNPQRLLLQDTEDPSPPDPATQGGALSGFSAGVIVSLASKVFSVIFLAIATLTMAVIALLLLYRYVLLSILLVLAPITWMFWVFPDLQSLFVKWWSKFIEWVFFLPAMTFFLYLAIQSAEALAGSKMFVSGNLSGFIGDIAKQGAQMVVLTALLLGGLIAAQKMGIEAAGGALKLANKAKDATSKYIGSKAQRFATAPLRSSLGKRATEWMQTAGQSSRIGKLLNVTGGVSLMRYAGLGLAKARMAEEKKAADAAKKLPKDLKEQALMAKVANAPQRVAIMNNISGERNKRSKKHKDARKKEENEKLKLTDVEEREQAELNKLTEEERMLVGSGTKAGDIRQRFAEAKEATQKAVKKAGEEAKEAADSLREIDDVIGTLPSNIQRDFAKSQLESKKGKIEMQNIPLGRRYGYRPGVVMPGEGKTEKIEAAIKAVTGEEEKEGKGGEKKEEPEKKPEINT
jgi:hypothetical protein